MDDYPEPLSKKFAWYLKLVVAYSLTVFYGTVWILGQIPFLWNDSKKYFATAPRSRPKHLEKPITGESGYLLLKNGIKIHYVAAGSASKPLMLFLHGFPEFWYSWRHQLRFFQNDYRVVAIDLRGYGDSSKPNDIASYTLDKLVDDVRLVIEELGHKKCILVGHDWGGILAWAFTNQNQEMVERLIIMNAPHPAAFKAFMQTNPKQILKSWYIFAFQIPNIPETILKSNDFHFLEQAFTKPPMGAKPGTITVEDVEAFKYTFSQPGALTGPVNYYRNVFTDKKTESIKWRVLDVPVLVIFGTNDGAISQEIAYLSKKYCARFELKYLDGISHWVNQEAPDEVNKNMKEFLVQ